MSIAEIRLSWLMAAVPGGVWVLFRSTRSTGCAVFEKRGTNRYNKQMKLVGAPGFEPGTPGSQSRCATSCATPRKLADWCGF